MNDIRRTIQKNSGLLTAPTLKSSVLTLFFVLFVQPTTETVNPQNQVGISNQGLGPLDGSDGPTYLKVNMLDIPILISNIQPPDSRPRRRVVLVFHRAIYPTIFVTHI
ncbi:hypothetical protein P691DRAFT_541129 [Macrolepiota fuliginosa MF-IS2]|uniref:Uncharacterized protein n=1 Tax=Macrolepiota fuliginosa MF-IS2 TaxID=1400762 RepID=A0A9P5XER5_9AGAR|nr:hypothetical protein P691DRAFT_541129 [Macrolepiota fuliginosa MF-IS2]